jgi:hypothetical protein
METLNTDPTLETIPSTQIDPDIDMFDIVEDTPAGPTSEEIAAQLETLRKENEALKQVSDLSSGMQQGFQTLAQQLQAQQPNQYDNLPGLPAPVQEQTPNFALPNKEEFERDFLTNPYDAFSKFLAPVVGNQQHVMNSQMAEMNKMISKNNAYMSESNKEILTKYGDEVQTYASRLQSNDPWGDAVKQVRSNHFQDIMNEKLKTAEETAYEKAKAELEAATQNLQSTQASPVGSTNLGANTNPGATKVKITKAQMDKVKALTATKFGPNSGPEVELQMFNYMKDNGML